MGGSQVTQLVLLLTFVAGTWAWSHHYGVSDFKWPFSRRSRMCTGEHEVCLQSSQCCDPMTCVKPVGDIRALHRRRPLAICKNLEKELDGARAWKPEGAECEDSSECSDLCCRVIKGFRGTFQLCGHKEGPFMCMQKVDNQHVMFGK